MKKYEMTEEIKIFEGKILHRIIALVDIPMHSVKAGDLGGWIECENNLSHNGDAWVYGDARVYGDAWVSGDAWVYGDARVYGAAGVAGGARVYGEAQVYGDARVYGAAWVYDDARVYGAARVSGEAQVRGDVGDTSPLQIQGTRWVCNMASRTIWRMGCCFYNLKEWVERFDEITAKNKQEDIKDEYWRYVRLACEMYAPELLEGIKK